jgi:hypothetical protein
VERIAKMNTIALILAAGEAERMSGEIKQLLPIRHSTIIGRVLAQAKMYKTRSIVVTHKDEIAGCHHRVHIPKNHDTVCESLLSTSHLWDDRTIVLLGDVVYSDYTMGLIMNSVDLIRVFGNTWEIFAIVFDKKNHAKVKTALRKGSKHRRGKLRYFYHAYCGFEMGRKEQETVPLENDVFYYVRDWTRDIDSPYEYERLLEEIVNTGKL